MTNYEKLSGFANIVFLIFPQLLLTILLSSLFLGQLKFLWVPPSKTYPSPKDFFFFWTECPFCQGSWIISGHLASQMLHLPFWWVWQMLFFGPAYSHSQFHIPLMSCFSAFIFCLWLISWLLLRANPPFMISHTMKQAHMTVCFVVLECFQGWDIYQLWVILV